MCVSQVPLVTALSGGSITLKHLDGHPVTVPIRSVTQPGQVVVVSGEGMPVSKKPGQKGDLIVKCDVTFPSSLTETQRQEIKRVLA